MYKYFFPVLLGGISIYYYYHFKSLNNSKLKIIEKDEIIEDEVIEDEVIEHEVIEDEVINNLNINKLEENVTLNDTKRYQIILYKEPLTIFNNWEIIN